MSRHLKHSMGFTSVGHTRVGQSVFLISVFACSCAVHLLPVAGAAVTKWLYQSGMVAWPIPLSSSLIAVSFLFQDRGILRVGLVAGCNHHMIMHDKAMQLWGVIIRCEAPDNPAHAGL